MGIGCRTLLIDGNDSLERIPMSRLERLLHFDRVESLLLYAGKRVRFAMVFVDVPGRQVLIVRNINYFLLPFNDKGRTDKKEWEKRLRLAMELPARLLKGQPPKQIVDVRHRFAKRRHEHEFKWKESRKVEEAIVAAIFNSGVTKL